MVERGRWLCSHIKGLPWAASRRRSGSSKHKQSYYRGADCGVIGMLDNGLRDLSEARLGSLFTQSSLHSTKLGTILPLSFVTGPRSEKLSLGVRRTKCRGDRLRVGKYFLGASSAQGYFGFQDKPSAELPAYRVASSLRDHNFGLAIDSRIIFPGAAQLVRPPALLRNEFRVLI